MSFVGENRGNTKIKTIAIIIAVILLALIINHWMGKEMNQSVDTPTPIQPAELTPENTVDQTAHIAPSMPEQEETVVAQPTSKSPTPKEEKIEPVYDTPSNSVILVQ